MLRLQIRWPLCTDLLSLYVQWLLAVSKIIKSTSLAVEKKKRLLQHYVSEAFLVDIGSTSVWIVFVFLKYNLSHVISHMWFILIYMFPFFCEGFRAFKSYTGMCRQQMATAWTYKYTLCCAASKAPLFILRQMYKISMPLWVSSQASAGAGLFLWFCHPPWLTAVGRKQEFNSLSRPKRSALANVISRLMCGPSSTEKRGLAAPPYPPAHTRRISSGSALGHWSR